MPVAALPGICYTYLEGATERATARFRRVPPGEDMAKTVDARNTNLGSAPALSGPTSTGVSRMRMEETMRKYRLVTSLAAAAAIVGMSQVVYGGVLVDADLDHLTCYRVRPAAPAEPFVLTVQLENQWAFAACTIEAPPVRMCAETRKNFGDDPRRDATRLAITCATAYASVK